MALFEMLFELVGFVELFGALDEGTSQLIFFFESFNLEVLQDDVLLLLAGLAFEPVFVGMLSLLPFLLLLGLVLILDLFWLIVEIVEVLQLVVVGVLVEVLLLGDLGNVADEFDGFLYERKVQCRTDYVFFRGGRSGCYYGSSL